MQSNRNTTTTGYLVYVLIILIMVGSLLAWQAWQRTDSFENFHRQLAATSVQGAADEIGVLFGELHRSMQLFVADRKSLLGKILHERDNEALWIELETAVQEHFPEVFGMTLTDADGHVLHPDFENRVDEICRRDIREFIERRYQEQGVIHPNPLGYHFDIMVPWVEQDVTRGIFFLSFHPALLARILQRMQPPGHTLLLLNRTVPGLIEVTAGGSRDALQREFFLESGEMDRILTTVPISGSRWDLVDLPAARLLSREAARNWIYSAIVFGVFVCVTLLMLYQLRRKERSRVQAEQRALRHQNELAHVDRLNILGEMASGIAHELNQPLTAISTYCRSGLRILDTLEDRPEKLVHALEASARQARRAGEIIHRMREFAAKGKARYGAIEINRVIADATEFVRPELDRRDITLQLDLAPGLPSVQADGIQIEQVLLNLVHNAIEAMRAAGGDARRLEIASRLAENGQIRVSVSDSGRGLQPEDMARLFETFYTTKAGGMGLGLAISRSIIEAHGGQLWAEPSAGPGATFCFSIPVAGMQ